jgi:hypothetical protein
VENIYRSLRQINICCRVPLLVNLGFGVFIDIWSMYCIALIIRLAPCLLYNLGDIATRADQPEANKQKLVTSVKKLTKEGEDKLTIMSSL